MPILHVVQISFASLIHFLVAKYLHDFRDHIILVVATLGKERI